jgi:hypothetical protein
MSSYKMGGVVVVPVKDWQAGGKGVPERYFIHHGQVRSQALAGVLLIPS